MIPDPRPLVLLQRVPLLLLLELEQEPLERLEAEEQGDQEVLVFLEEERRPACIDLGHECGAC